MIRKHDEDLFKDTTMTFGEHLEELRSCLVRSLAGLVVAFLFGLYVAGDVVQFIETPLTGALARYYSDLAIEKYEQEVAKGTELPYTLDEVVQIVTERQLLFDVVYVNPPELSRQIGEDQDPAAEEPTEDNSGELPATAAAGTAAEGDPAAAPASTPAAKAAPEVKLVSFLLWHRVADDSRIRLIGLSAQEGFVIWVKAALVVAAVLASPWVFYQIWSFVAAGLYPHEKRYVHLFLPFSIGLFLLGASVAFFFVFEPVLNFLLSFYKSMGIDPDQRISDWLSFVLVLPLGFGISFQLPLVMLFLERIGIFDVKAYLEKWRIAILVIFVIAMFLTPADPYSMLLMAVPLTFLYFGGILLCKYLPKGRNPFAEE